MSPSSFCAFGVEEEGETAVVVVASPPMSARPPVASDMALEVKWKRRGRVTGRERKAVVVLAGVARARNEEQSKVAAQRPRRCMCRGDREYWRCVCMLVGGNVNVCED